MALKEDVEKIHQNFDSCSINEIVLTIQKIQNIFQKNQKSLRSLRTRTHPSRWGIPPGKSLLWGKNCQGWGFLALLNQQKARNSQIVCCIRLNIHRHLSEKISCKTLHSVRRYLEFKSGDY